MLSLHRRFGPAALVTVACGGGPVDGSASTSGITSISAGDDDGASGGPSTSAADDDGGVTVDGSSGGADSTGIASTGGSDGSTAGSEGGPDSGSDSGGSGDESSSDGGETGQEVCDCAPNTELIYVLSDDAELWSFDPITLDFALIGPLNCGNTATFSMGVDRNGIAWVMFQDQDIRTIDVNNPVACMDPGYAPGQLGFGLYGMAFVSESAEDPCDQLYAQSYSGVFQEAPNAGKLGVVDPATLLMMQIGLDDYDGGELTGTGAGQLFMFAGINPAKLIELDKSNANVLSVLPLGTVELTNAFAFAHYGGDFYIFTEEPGAFPIYSQVIHLDYDDSDGNGTQDITVLVPQAPIRIVGAGVSTCAPIVS